LRCVNLLGERGGPRRSEGRNPATQHEVGARPLAELLSGLGVSAGRSESGGQRVGARRSTSRLNARLMSLSDWSKP